MAITNHARRIHECFKLLTDGRKRTFGREYEIFSMLLGVQTLSRLNCMKASRLMIEVRLRWPDPAFQESLDFLERRLALARKRIKDRAEGRKERRSVIGRPPNDPHKPLAPIPRIDDPWARFLPKEDGDAKEH